ncbi:MAG: helix-turn-helix domain-containing protein [Acidobacteria bacterium]|nr:helix-turn-helix domain-containing protein [Acidobacteriota bacterium]MCI0721226.1 helix-turn-helix domain-containing protein [Acidobacteriota bacterium]
MPIYKRYLWTEKLDQVLREGYKQGGRVQSAAIAKIQSLTGWPKYICYRQASFLGLAEAHSQYNWTAELDTLLQEGYKQGGRAKLAAIQQIQSQTGWPRYVCWNRARKLQLAANCHGRNKPWSEAEDRYLLDFVGSKNPREIAKRLKRSVGAIRGRLRILGKERRISLRVQDGHTKEELARYLGRSKKTIKNWIDSGWLKARYEGKNRKDDTLRITDEDFRSFWKRHPWEVPFYRLSKEGLLWFCSVMHDVPPAFTFGDPLDRKQRRQEQQEEEDLADEEVLDG